MMHSGAFFYKSFSTGLPKSNLDKPTRKRANDAYGSYVNPMNFLEH